MNNLTRYQNFKAAMANVQKELTITIANGDLENLKKTNSLLCFSIGNNDNHTVIWQAYSNYLTNNRFSWTPQYQLFGTNQFKTGQEVFVSTNTVDIKIGESSTMDAAGLLSTPVADEYATGFILNNEFGSIYPGYNQLSTGINGQQISTPAFVLSDPVLKNYKAAISPGEQLLLWFEQNVKTSMLFTSPRPNSVLIDMTDLQSQNMLYEDGTWKKTAS